MLLNLINLGKLISLDLSLPNIFLVLFEHFIQVQKNKENFQIEFIIFFYYMYDNRFNPNHDYWSSI
jgi:hypothetical protein